MGERGEERGEERGWERKGEDVVSDAATNGGGMQQERKRMQRSHELFGGRRS